MGQLMGSSPRNRLQSIRFAIGEKPSPANAGTVRSPPSGRARSSRTHRRRGGVSDIAMNLTPEQARSRRPRRTGRPPLDQIDFTWFEDEEPGLVPPMPRQGPGGVWLHMP
ncbi:hypothetical protein Slala04_26160 [Streptomyces lavendulae subsp. lavendulae]|nr:hypothetical protein Slala04_26160 [Streptomyces lavendulae subsp. lavendulae]